MSNLLMYKIVITDYFKKQLRPLVKKDRDLKEVLKKGLEDFEKSSKISLGNNIFKMRLRRLDKGKSGGYRIIIFVMEIEGILTPLSIYSKSDQTSISKKEITNHLERTKEELETLNNKSLPYPQ